jgi:hypothetical protein
MRSLLARLAVLGAFAVSVSGCTGTGASLPFAGPPNSAGGNPGTFQSGSNGSMLVRFVNGAPNNGGGTSFLSATNVDVCIDNFQFSGGTVMPLVPYGRAAGGANSSQNTLVALAAGATAGAGITHTISVYPSPIDSTGAVIGSQVGLECPTAPGPYLLSAPVAITTLAAVANTRITVVLGGSPPPPKGTGTLGLYVFSDPTFPTSPATASAYWHNAAPDFSAARVAPAPKTVGFGYCTTTVTPCAVATNLTGASSVPPGAKSTDKAAVVNNQSAQSLLPLIPAGFFDGAGVLAGAVVPITSVATPALAAGQAPVFGLIAIDAPAGGLNLVVIPEQTNGYGF